MAKKVNKAEFGKGIRALLANPQQLDQAVKDNPQEVVRELTGNVAMISIKEIEVNPYQPRVEFDQTALDELADSIRVHGLIQPMTVRRLHDKAYQIISGERRFRASQLAGLEEVPAYVRLADDQQMLEMALIENIQREDLNAVEIAISYQRLIDECNLSHENLSERVGKQRSTITNYLRLLKLPVDIQQAVKAKRISMGHARALAGVSDISFQLSLLNQIVQEDLSVRAVESLIQRYQEDRLGKKGKPDNKLPEHLRTIQDQFSAFFGAKTVLKRDAKGKGQIVLKFENDNELNRMIDAIEAINAPGHSDS
ncbi:MAG: ParB/RepB/Spo0J family partition protein [Lewinellaceae bacterium]|nr:ParB/RepB/Spo0J family partition protein [Lewinellaceae bacterium]